MIIKHYFNKSEQAKTYASDIANVCVEEAVMHVDYSENYKNRQQREVKAAFYDQGQFSLYTLCIYVCVDGKVQLHKEVIKIDSRGKSRQPSMARGSSVSILCAFMSVYMVKCSFTRR